MFRRRPRRTEPEWRARLDAARHLIRPYEPSERVEDRIDHLERALVATEADLGQLTTTIAHLDPDRTTQELKRVLRRPASTSTTESDPATVALQERFRAVNLLQNRREALRGQIDAAIADVERLAARSVARSADGHGVEAINDALADLQRDLTALELAHLELRDL